MRLRQERMTLTCCRKGKQMNEDKKLKGRDLINIGIYGAIYFVILFAVAMLGMIPIFLPLLSVFVPILGGIPFMLFLTRVKKPGMIFIFAMIMGILMLLTGMGPWPLLTCAVAGLLAELVFKSGDYRDAKKAVLSYGLFSMWIFGNYLPLFTDLRRIFCAEGGLRTGVYRCRTETDASVDGAGPSDRLLCLRHDRRTSGTRSFEKAF